MFILEKALTEIFQPKRKAGVNYYLTRADLSGVQFDSDFSTAKDVFQAMRPYIMGKKFEYHLLLILDNGEVIGALETTARHKSQADIFGELGDAVSVPDFTKMQVSGLLPGDKPRTYADAIRGKTVVSLHNHPMDSDMRMLLTSPGLLWTDARMAGMKLLPSRRDRVARYNLQGELKKVDAKLLSMNILTPISCYSILGVDDELFIQPVKLRLVFARKNFPDKSARYKLVDFPVSGEAVSPWLEVLGSLSDDIQREMIFLFSTKILVFEPDSIRYGMERALIKHEDMADRSVLKSMLDIIRQTLSGWPSFLNSGNLVVYASSYGGRNEEIRGKEFINSFLSAMRIYKKTYPGDNRLDDATTGIIFHGLTHSILGSMSQLLSGKALLLDMETGEESETSL